MRPSTRQKVGPSHSLNTKRKVSKLELRDKDEGEDSARKPTAIFWSGMRESAHLSVDDLDTGEATLQS